MAQTKKSPDFRFSEVGISEFTLVSSTTGLPVHHKTSTEKTEDPNWGTFRIVFCTV